MIEKFHAHYKEGGFWMPILYPFLTGRLARWKQFERWLEGILVDKDVWFSSFEKIVVYIEKLAVSGDYVPRVDTLPYYHKPVILEKMKKKT